MRTSANSNDGYFGARLLGGGAILNEVHLTQGYAGYTQVSVQLTTGSSHSVEVYAGLWAHDADTWMRVDDLSLVKN